MEEKPIYIENPFEYLRPNLSADEVVKNWYVARAFVLDKLGALSFAPGEAGHLHVIIDGDSPIMLAVLRQVALTAHYPNFVEYDELDNLVCRNRTLITLVSNQKPDDILSELKKEEYLCNLLDLCKYSVGGKVFNEDSYIDVEIEIVDGQNSPKDGLHFCEDDVKLFMAGKKEDDICSIDTRKAFYASKAYELGSAIESIPYEDINDAGRFNKALDTFQYKVLRDKGKIKLIDEGKWAKNKIAVKLGLSNIICADSFESREQAIKKQCSDYDKLDYDQKHALWEKDAHALSLCEHGRWVVEKLIFGFSPFSQEQRNEYERRFGDRRKAFAKRLKNNASSPAHFNLCSYRDLRRVDPDNLKYDCFLTLAIPLILDEIRKQDSKRKKNGKEEEKKKKK